MLRSAHGRILFGLLAGAALGVLAHAWAPAPLVAGAVHYVSQPLGQIFLRLLFMLVIPLVFAGLALGVSGLGDLRRLGRIGLRTLGCTVLLSTIAVVIGLLLVNGVRPGEGVGAAERAALTADAAGRAAGLGAAQAPQSGWALLVGIVPDNPFKAAANGDMLAVMFFALMIGVGLALTRTDAARRFEENIEGLYDVTMRLIGIVIGLAPLGVAALLFTLTAQIGWSVLLLLARYTLLVIGALALQQFVVYALAVRLLGGMSAVRFFRGIQAAMLTAFSTASSSATLPTSLRVAASGLGLPRHVSRFVLTLGASANQNGTALFEGITVLFLAQFYAVPLDLGQQGLVLFICILGGIGTAGVPAGSLPVIAMILGMIGVPVEGIGLVLGVDRLLDMCRTTVNVSGDLAIAAIVSRGEPADA
ncbi:MAG: dicarboxylate/amino acid:cation symporter [Gammaproteobacteria bacterium]|nr:dicarboxylate/amino acid:cation symporter [Gammaproteobacteria bacterium]